MPIKCLGRGRGFGAQSLRPRGSQLVWNTVKECFGSNQAVMDQIKLYHRSSPNLNNLYDSVQKYDRVYTTRPKDDTLLEQVLLEAREKFRPPSILKLTHINDMDPSDFPSGTSPCLPFVFMTNPETGLPFRKKGECWEQAKFYARYWAHQIKEDNPCRLPPAMVFARGKVCTRDKEKTRAIWGKSFSLLIMQAIFFRELWKYYLKGQTPMAYGYTPFRRGARKLQEDIERAGYRINGMNPILSLDFSEYDTSIPPWLIFEVYKIFSEYMDFSKYKYHGTPDPSKTSKLYWRLARECVNTRFRMPDGYEFKKHGGVDSGSLDFQLIECVCTWIMITYAIRHQGRNPTFLTCLGDDSLTLVEGCEPVDLTALANVIKHVFGVSLNLEKSSQTTDLRQAKFLGRYCVQGLPRKQIADVVLSALLPSRTDESPLDTAERIIALAYDSGGTNFQVMYFLKACWNHIAKELSFMGYNMAAHDWSTRWKKKFTMWGLGRPPEFRFPTDQDLYLLTDTTVYDTEIERYYMYF